MVAKEIRLIVSVTGGVVETVRADSPNVRLSVLDHDLLETPDARWRALNAEFKNLPHEIY